MPSVLGKTKGDYTVNKEDILALSRKENDGKCDERESFIVSKASKISQAVGGLICVLLAFLTGFVVDKPEIALCSWLVYFAMSATEHWILYSKLKKRVDLIFGVISAIVVITTVCILPGLLR